MSDIDTILKKLLKFRQDRNWEQFHKPKDLAISLSLEASEVLEHFQWKTNEEIESYIKDHREDIAEELADVFNWVLLMSNDLEIDILKASVNKIDKNALKYPQDKSKGTHRKYTELL